MQVLVSGAGLVGRRCAVRLAARGHTVALQPSGRPAPTVDGVTSLDPGVRVPFDPDLVVLASESARHPTSASQWLADGVDVVSTADNPAVVRQLWSLGPLAEGRNARLVVGAAFAPGISSLLVAHLAGSFSSISSITTARFGTGGPTCAREHHRSMAARGFEVRGGNGAAVRGGTGRTLVWFPEPIGGQDCYRAGLADAWLLAQAFGEVPKVQALQAATRRDRVTARLPMLRPPHPEGLVGACWAEVRGQTDGGGVKHRMLAAQAPQATGAAVAAALTVEGIARFQPGVSSLAAPPAAPLLRSLPDDVGLWAYDGSQHVPEGSNAPIQAARKWRGPKNSATQRPIAD